MRRFLAILMALTVCFALVFCVSAASETEFVVDSADLLTASEEEELNEKLAKIQKEYQLDVMIVTVSGSYSIQKLDDYAQAQYYAAGMGDDGIVLIRNITTRDWRYVLFGKSDKKVGEKEHGELKDAIEPSLRNDAHMEAFESFVDTYVEIMDRSIISVTAIVVSLLIGALLAFLIPMSMLKGQLKSVRMQPAASSYVRQNSMRVNVQRDIFLYRNVTRTAKPKNNSGGHSGRTSSGNTSRGGRA